MSYKLKKKQMSNSNIRTEIWKPMIKDEWGYLSKLL